MDRERLDTWCERTILGLVLAVLVYTPLATGAVRAQDFAVVQWLTVLVLAVWACRFAINPKHRLLWPMVCWPVLVFMGYAVVRCLQADIEYVARQETVKVLTYGFLFFAILNNLHRLELTYVVAMAVVFLGMAIGMYAVIQYLTESDRVWHFVRPDMYRQRGSGTFINPNNLAGYLAMVLPMGLAYTLTGRLKDVKKILVGYATLMVFAGVVVTFSRWGWLAAGVSLTVFFLWLMRQRDYRLQGLLMLSGFLLIAAVLGWLVQPSKQGRQDRLTQAAKVENLRFKVWGPATQIWKDHFWWGAGPAHFDYRFRQYRPADEELQVRPDRVHNDYLNTLADWGLIGALLVVAAWIIFYGEVFRSWRFVQRAPNDFAAKRSNKASCVLGGALGLLAILVHSFLDFNMHVPANAILAVTWMALVSGHFRFATEQHWHTVRWPLRIPVALGLGAALVYLGAQAWVHTREAFWLARADRLPEYSSERIAALRNAFAVDDANFETAYQIGEALRLQHWQDPEDFPKAAPEAIQWFERSEALNPHYPYSFLRHGMCLTWLRQPRAAEPYFQRALSLDPNGYYTVAHLGWQFVQIEDWATAKGWFEKSLSLKQTNNPIASIYLDIVRQKLGSDPGSAATADP